MSTIKILYLAADPYSAPPDGRRERLRLDENARKIQEEVDVALYGRFVEVKDKWAVRTSDLHRALMRERPQIVHFSGHGETDGLVLVSSDGGAAQRVTGDALGRLLHNFRSDIKLVVLSACHSKELAETIREKIGCAIGTSGPVGDEGAIVFDAAFYFALASGRSVREAYDEACAVRGVVRPTHLNEPELLVRPDIDPSQLVFLPPQSVSRRFTINWGLALGACVATAAGALAMAFGLLASLAIGLIPLLLTAPLFHNRQRSLRVRRRLTAGSLLFWLIGVLWMFDDLAAPGTATPAAGGPATAMLCTFYSSEEVRTSEHVTEKNAHAGKTELTAAAALFEAGDFTSAFPLLQRATAEGELGAKAYLGISYLCGLGTTRDPALGGTLIHEAATKERDPRGMVYLALAYELGEGRPQTPHRAEEWFGKAAALGDAEAMRHLARLALGGNHVDSAMGLLRRAQAAGSLDATVDLGYMHEQKLPEPRRDTAQARRLYLAAAERGAARGMFALGRLHEARGDLRAARSWYEKAAEKGSADAMNNLGVLYQVAERGDGVRRSRLMAQRWYRRAADAGSTEAAANLAAMRRG